MISKTYHNVVDIGKDTRENWIPIVPAVIIGPNEYWASFDFVFDTGCNSTAMPKEYARVFDVKLEKRYEVSLRTANQEHKAYSIPGFTLQIFDKEIKCNVTFQDIVKNNLYTGMIGTYPVFHDFDFGIVYREKSLYISYY